MKRTAFFLVLIILTGCNKQPSHTFQYRLNLLADRSCRAMSIRKQRFELANNIRFVTDTLARTKSKRDSVRLQSQLAFYNKQKGVLLKASIRLADTIHRQLDSLVPYNDKAAEKRFTAQLHELLAKKGCKDPDQ